LFFDGKYMICCQYVANKAKKKPQQSVK